jgi:hypothetical protein
MNNIFTLKNEDLQKFNPQQAVEIFRDLLWVEARRLGIPVNKVRISSRINVRDGGVDAAVEPDGIPQPVLPDGLIKIGRTAYQIKASDSFKPHQNAEIRNELFGKNQPADKEHLGSSIRDCLDIDGTYVLVCFRQDLVELEWKQAKEHLESYFRECGYKTPKVEVWGQHTLIGFISAFPSLALRVNGHSEAEFQTHRSWSLRDTMLPCLVSGEAQENVIEGIRGELRRSDEPIHIRVVGEAGIGKTKIVLEATRVDDLAPLILYCNAERFVNSVLMNELLRDDNHYSAILILDECDENNKSLIWNQFKHRGNRVKIISISNEFGSPSGDLKRFVIEPLSPSQSSSIIQSYSVPKDRADIWSPFCSGYPRVAHVIGQNLIANPDDVFKSPDTVNVWRRFLTGTDSPESEQVRQRERVLCHLALFKKFGYTQYLETEARAIAGLITEADPNITWPKFQEIIKELKGRKILQGAYTLYITPKLFHIKLWADWWETYGMGFDLQKFSEALPPRLLEWFYEMFEYAHTSQAASRTVKWLLSADGPFQNTDFLNSKLGGDFFLALSKTEPKAALNCLRRTIGTWNKEDLLGFDKGRRQVVWALEYIAVERELFADAARLLLKLGEAENERYANNASGVFVDFFTMAWGDVAPTEASPEEKLPVLREALESNSQEKRALALKACAKSLEDTDYFYRTINTNFTPLHRIQNRWTPKTYGEWFDGYRGVWKLIEEKVEKLPEVEKERAAKLLLGGAYGIGKIPALADMVIATLRDLLRKNYLDRFELIDFLSRFLHKKWSEDLQPEVRRSWEKLRDEISPCDFPSLMKRYVALDLLTDKFDDEERYIDQAQPKIEELAQEAVGSVELLKPELTWLTTTEAQRGYDFGYSLGKCDIAKGFSLLPTLIKAQRESLGRENASAFFLGGYFRALRQADESSLEQVLDILAQADDFKALIPELTFRGGITERAAQRIADLAERGDISFGHFRLFEYGLEILKLSEGTFERWIKYLLSQNDLYAICISLNLMALYYLRETNAADEHRPSLPKEITFNVLTHPSLFNPSGEPMGDQMALWRWGMLAGRYIKLYARDSIELAKVILKNFGSDGPAFANLREYPSEALNRIARIYPFEVWQIATKYLGPPIDVRAWRVKDWLHKGGVHFGKSPSSEVATIPLDVLWAWVDEDVEKRAWYLATIVTPVLFNNEDNTCLARELLIRYGQREDVRTNLAANFGTEGWWGSASEHYTSKKQWLLDYRKKEDHPNVLRWLDEYVEETDSQIEWARIREEREF